MTEIHAQTVARTMLPSQASVSWYRALTLQERRATPHQQACSLKSVPVSEDQRKRALADLQDWKDSSFFRDTDAYSERLAQDGMTENELLALLEETEEELQQRISPLPDWLSLLSEYPSDPTEDSEEPLLARLPGEANAELLACLRPLLRLGISRFRARLAALRKRSVQGPFDFDALPTLFWPNLLNRLRLVTYRVLALELNIARIQKRLAGETPKERLGDFISQVGDQGLLHSLLEMYPVMARQTLATIDLWIDYSIEFLTHLCEDWPALCTTFAAAGDLGRLVVVGGSAGDSHRGGRSVLKLKFDTGLQLIYKPKPMAIDVHFQEFLAWLNQQSGDMLPFRTMHVIDRGTYGWAEFIEARACTSPEQVARFYERQGAYLALLHMLEATDFHHENLIAHGEHPMLIDLEALFQSRGGQTAEEKQDQFLLDVMSFSVLRVGLLPQRIMVNEEFEGIDISGLGGKSQLTAQPVPGWEDIGTDQVRMIKKRVLIEGQDNRPLLDGQDVDLLQYADQIEAGFTKMYRVLLAQRETLLHEQLPRFAHDEIRFIARATRIYAQLLLASYHPDVMQNALDRDALLDRLWSGARHVSYLKRLIKAEREDLYQGDIPMFTTTPIARHVFTSRGEIIDDVFDQASMETVRHRLRHFNEGDLHRQVWFIRASLTSITMGIGQSTWKHSVLRLPQQRVQEDKRLVKSARAIGDRLCELALSDAENASWIGINLVAEKQWMLTPSGIDLYNGLPGIALYLAYLGKITGEVRYSTLARQALGMVQRVQGAMKESSRMSSVGGFDGWGAVIYFYLQLGVLWSDASLLDEAEHIGDFLPSLIEADRSLDVLGGTAGCLLALLALYRARPSKSILRLAILCGDHLLAQARPQNKGIGWITALSKTEALTGFSHGAAGIALSLLSLASVTGEQRFQQAALNALTFERNHFSFQEGNWPDLRDISQLEPGSSGEGEHHPYMVAWCHGAAGIGLGRLAALKYIDDIVIRDEIEVALQTTIERGFGQNHSLCHGDMGNLELLFVAAQVLGRPQLREQAGCYLTMILDSIERQGWLPGVPLGIETPGLMTGLAGIGYEMLRCIDPELVPSILLLAPPSLSAGPARKMRKHKGQTGRKE